MAVLTQSTQRYAENRREKIVGPLNLTTPCATVTLSGSQSVTTTIDDRGNYFFTNLPTSGDYVITASKSEYTFNSATATFITPSGDQTADFTAQLMASLRKFSISGRVLSSNGEPMAGVLVTLSGSVSRFANRAASEQGSGRYQRSAGHGHGAWPDQ